MLHTLMNMITPFHGGGCLKFRLSYQFEPGEEADGVTGTYPAAIELNQVEPIGLRLRLIPVCGTSCWLH